MDGQVLLAKPTGDIPAGNLATLRRKDATRISRERGTWRELGEHTYALATWHPSAVLRMPQAGRRQACAEMAADLHELAVALTDRHH